MAHPRFVGLTCSFAAQPRADCDRARAGVKAVAPAGLEGATRGDLYEIFVRTFGFITLTFAISGSQ
jgi:hypothetical protein